MLTEITNGGITSPQGFTAAGVKAGIKKSGKEDVAVLYSTVPAAAAAVFTLNTMAAAPVLVDREVVAQGRVSAIAINSGCANACTGEEGLRNAREMAKITADLLKLPVNEVLVASTGIIGVNLPMTKLKTGLEQAVAELSVTGQVKASQAIMTTDTFPKTCAYTFSIGGKTATIGGMAKGSGMIHPNMATMLAFLTTDAAVSAPVLQQALTEAVNVSFNMISVDGDTSTNDMVSVMANGLAGNAALEQTSGADYEALAAAVKQACLYLAQQVARDGEGATKFLAVTVRGAVDFADAKRAAMSIAKSPLVKTAFFGQDPNWGRVLCAVGYSGAKADPGKTSLALGGITIVQAGLSVAYDENALRGVMAASDIAVTVDLGLGTAEATVWTCDFSYEYVKINGEYHT